MLKQVIYTFIASSSLLLFFTFVILPRNETTKQAFWHRIGQKKILSTIQNIEEKSGLRLENKSCDPKQNIMFLKTHKTGGSTLQNILVRYAYDNDKFVGLPKRGNLFGYWFGKSFTKKSMMPPPNSTQVNMLLHHMVFNYTEVSSVLPSDTIYFSILRDPATQFESVFYYFKHIVLAFKRAYLQDPVKQFLSNTKRYFRGPGDGNLWWFGKNNMIFDFGFDNLNESDEYIEHAVKEIDRIFDFILIAEYFDISLILLKDLLCWDMKDIVYLSMNAREKSSVKHVTGDVINKTREWNKVDTALYKYFNESFWKRVEKYGKTRLENDLKEFEILKNIIRNRCVEDELQNNQNVTDEELKLLNRPAIKLTQYKLKTVSQNDILCRNLILPEVSWCRKLLQHEYG